MIVGIHQPNYLPYLGFFDKMKRSDIFVIYDDAQFNKEDFQQRNKIKIYQGWKWLNVPVLKEYIPIKDIKIRNELTLKNVKWSNAHLRDIHDNYKNAPYYEKYKNDFETIYNTNYARLIDLNMDIIKILMKAFDIKTKLVFSSDLGFSSKSTERLVEIVEAVEGDIYLSGSMGRNYLDLSLFDRRDIKVEFQDFKHPIYRQCYENFIPNMSAIDALFNAGEIPGNNNVMSNRDI
jgi:hypothetical protein